MQSCREKKKRKGRLDFQRVRKAGLVLYMVEGSCKTAFWQCGMASV